MTGETSLRPHFGFGALADNASGSGEQNSISSDHVQEFDSDELFAEHMKLLKLTGGEEHDNAELEEVRTTPIFSMPVKRAAAEYWHDRSSFFPQFGLLAGRLDTTNEVIELEVGEHPERQDPRMFLNVNAPWSTFICGSQGSGKSYSLSCMLENCMLPHPTLGALPKPLTGLLFHYDSHTSSFGGQACEAASLCSSGIDVTVLVSPTNLEDMTSLYENLPGLAASGRKPTVEPLLLDQNYLNAERLMTLMSAGNSEGPMPLYMQSMLQILREMALVPKRKPGIDYIEFKKRVLAKDLTPAQLSPLKLRLQLLESFIAVPIKGLKQEKIGNSWIPSSSKLTIVDLSCPFVDSDTACGLFEMCLGVFLEQKMDIGRVVALDEAHKFMKDSTAANKLTDSLMTAIRLQRHLACRVIIATQEPTISPRLLDLCSITLVHRFTSPDWIKTLKAHLAAVSMEESTANENSIFAQIVRLNTGEALLFAPSAMLDPEEIREQDGTRSWKFRKLGIAYLHVRIRGRLTFDGGRSICAVK